MFVVIRNGRVFTGWKAWLIGIVAFIGLTLLFSLIAFVLLGVAVTMGAAMMIIVPVAVVGALLASLFTRRP